MDYIQTKIKEMARLNKINFWLLKRTLREKFKITLDKKTLLTRLKDKNNDRERI